MIRTFISAVVLAIALTQSASLTAAEPLHVRIDKILDATDIGPQAKTTSDAEFLRRVYLDLTGNIPSPDEARAFLDDKSPDKRVKLIDRLLAGPGYARQMTNAFTLMLMERRSDPADWQQWLRESIEQNKPWNQIASEILGADGSDPKTRGATNFFIARSVEPNLMTREVGRMFFGMDLQCAQCHDHPRIDSYYQRDYYGIFAFVSGIHQVKVGKKPAMLGEKVVGIASFKSVFTDVSGQTRPRLPGDEQITEPTFKKGEEYKVKPAKNVVPVPKFSRRDTLAKLVLKGENLAFRRNAVNRLWAMVMGRGIVHPPDLLHNDNPPSHPELLDLLANEFAAMKFDVKAFLREVMLTKAYQRSVALPKNLIDASAKMGPRVAALKVKQKEFEAKADALENQVSTAKDANDALRTQIEKAILDVKKANAEIAAVKKSQPNLTKALTTAQKRLAPKQSALSKIQATVEKTRATVQANPKDNNASKQLAQLEAQLKKANAEVAVLQKAVDKSATAVQSAKDRIANAQKKITELTQTQEKGKKQLAASILKVRELQREEDAATLSLRVIERRLSTIQVMMDYVKLTQEKNPDQESLDTAYQELTRQWSEQFVIGALEPLSPEQMGWSVMKVTGILDRQVEAELAVLNKKPLKPAEKKDPAKVAARQSEAEEAAHTKLARNISMFVKLFGLSAGQPQYDFFATADQAMFFSNGSQIQSWLNPSRGNLTDRLNNLAEPEKVAEELYLSVLTRRPTPQEVTDVTDYLAARPKDKPAAVREMVWALLSSNEFRFHH